MGERPDGGALPPAEDAHGEWASGVFASGCRQSLSLGGDGHYRLAITCGPSGGRITETAEGTYTLTASQADFHEPVRTSCPHTRLKPLMRPGKIDVERVAAGEGLALLQGHTLVQSFSRTTRADAPTLADGKPGCLGRAWATLLPEMTD